MPDLSRSSRVRRLALASSLLLVAGLSALASGQVGGAKPPSRHFEYVHQEVLANSLTQSLNELDGQGWEIFQVIPAWQIKGENAETILAPRAYEILGRRVIAAK